MSAVLDQSVPDTAPITGYELYLLRSHSCGRKPQLTEAEARHARRQARRRGVLVDAYRCLFAGDHIDVEAAWHVGHQPSMDTIATMARYIRFGATA